MSKDLEQNQAMQEIEKKISTKDLTAEQLAVAIVRVLNAITTVLPIVFKIALKDTVTVKAEAVVTTSEPEQVSVAENTSTPEQPPAPEPLPVPARTVTQSDIIAVGSRLVKKDRANADKIRALLKNYSADCISKLALADYEAVITALETLDQQ